MKKRFAFTGKRLAGFLCCALLPAAAMALGVYFLTTGVVFTLAFAVVYILLPLGTAALLACCIFSNSKIWRKVVLSTVILILFVLVFPQGVSLGGYVRVGHFDGEEAVGQYASVKEEHALMPSLSEVGQPTEIECHKVRSFQFIFSWDTDYLICRYTPEEYETEKSRLDDIYIFQEKAIIDSDACCEPSAELEGYVFRMLSTEGEYERREIDYPKRIMLVACSDEAKEIVYVAYEDVDLDYISSLPDHITDDCGWKYIR